MLLEISTALFNKPPFKNLNCTGLVLAADGQKTSKRKKIYPDRMEVLHKYGVDALSCTSSIRRLSVRRNCGEFDILSIYLEVVANNDVSFSFKEDGVKDIIKDVCRTLIGSRRRTRLFIDMTLDFVFASVRFSFCCSRIFSWNRLIHVR
ncbi:isoleucine--tRNA ligase, cytoplasmic isoform X1 [Culex quinquefasciatus]|uniref:isoleucine--tRNA ligase, cytoplasmic-like isoform X1 n=1 Tax=Culex quinquefasciatus TaxID=7176 RepID=UPI0018E3B76D|nr:isoleucine--tRNA ligase, cytoplasmic-like isoform X1 [Culex quinquefasciatus]XP_038123018.1 isoleucine--tRNA ligase, cytoplasmic isoform X1 [Culex quinquefasciatus]XP_039448698.1 isoleucine--tRNA ligase, cytoplasmic-like isoform X2 [Culex pipiens pallens]